MTDDRTQNDQADRIQQLKERRAASAPSTTGRRPHPAATTRIVLAGLSVASFFGIAGSVALANSTTAAVSQPAPPSAVVVNGTRSTPVAAAAKAATQAGTPTRVVAHTTTRGS